MDNGLTRSSIIRSLLAFSLPTWINAVLGVVAVPIVTRLFEPEVLGKFNLFSTYSTILFCIALIGINQGIMRFYHEPPGRNTTGGFYKLCHSVAAVSVCLVIGGIIVCRVYLSNAIAGEYDPYLVLCLALFVVAATFLNVVNSSFRMRGATLAYGVMTVLMNVGAKLTYVGATLLDDKFVGAITLITISYVALAVFYMMMDLFRYRKEPVVFGRDEIIPLLTYSLPLMPVLFISQINTALPKVMIASSLGYSEVGVYTSAYSIVSLISVVQSGINVFWAPFVYKNYSKYPEYLSAGHDIIAFAMTVFGLGVILAQDFIYLAIGPNYHGSQSFFPLLLFAPVCYTISETTGVGINISKKTYLNLVVYGVTILVTLVLCRLLVPVLHLEGAAIAVAMAALVMLIIKTLLGERYYRVINSRTRSFLAPTLFLVVAAANTFYFEYFHVRSLITFFGMLLVCVIYREQLRVFIGEFRKWSGRPAKGDG